MPRARLAKGQFVQRAVEDLIRKTSVGDMLITEEALARDLGCSRGTLRNALDPYVRQGVILRRRGGGTILVRHPDSRPDDVVLEIWTPPFEQKDPMKHAWWADLVDHGPDLKFVQQSTRVGDTLEARQLACGAMRVSATPSLELLQTPDLVEQAGVHALADLTDARKVLPSWQNLEEWSWSLVTVKDRIVGIPLIASAFGIWIESDLIERSAWKGRFPGNWEELTEALLKFKRASGKALPATPATDCPHLLSTLTAMAGGSLQYDERQKPSKRAMAPFNLACQWYSDLVRTHRLIDPTLTFNKSPWAVMKQRTFGFFHGTVPISPDPAPFTKLEDYTFWPIPAAKRGVAHHYPIMVYAFALNRRLNQEERQAALRYVAVATAEPALRRACESEQKIFLPNKNQWRWPETPRWVAGMSDGWHWILKQPLSRLTTPAGISPRALTDIYVRVLLGEQIVL